jgi:hypothetical protein
VAWLKRSQDRGGTQRRTPGQLSPDEQKKRAAWAKEDG